MPPGSAARQQILLGLLQQRLLAPAAVWPDDTIERAGAPRFAREGSTAIQAAPHAVTWSRCRARSLSLMLLAPIPWANRVWALPVLTTLAPSERYYANGNGRLKRFWTGRTGGVPTPPLVT